MGLDRRASGAVCGERVSPSRGSREGESREGKQGYRACPCMQARPHAPCRRARMVRHRISASARPLHARVSTLPHLLLGPAMLIPDATSCSYLMPRLAHTRCHVQLPRTTDPLPNAHMLRLSCVPHNHLLRCRGARPGLSPKMRAFADIIAMHMCRGAWGRPVRALWLGMCPCAYAAALPCTRPCWRLQPRPACVRTLCVPAASVCASGLCVCQRPLCASGLSATCRVRQPASTPLAGGRTGSNNAHAHRARPVLHPISPQAAAPPSPSP